MSRSSECKITHAQHSIPPAGIDAGNDMSLITANPRNGEQQRAGNANVLVWP